MFDADTVMKLDRNSDDVFAVTVAMYVAVSSLVGRATASEGKGGLRQTSSTVVKVWGT